MNVIPTGISPAFEAKWSGGISPDSTSIMCRRSRHTNQRLSRQPIEHDLTISALISSGLLLPTHCSPGLRSPDCSRNHSPWAIAFRSFRACVTTFVLFFFRQSGVIKIDIQFKIQKRRESSMYECHPDRNFACF